MFASRWSRGALLVALVACSVACSDTRILPRRTPTLADDGQSGAGGDAAAGAPGPSAGGENSGPDALGGGGGQSSLPALRVRELSAIQTVEVPLIVDGAPVPREQRNAPLIANKRALFRAQVELDLGYQERALRGVLEVENGGSRQEFVSERSFRTSSSREALASSFVFDVGPRDIRPEARYRLRVLESDATAVLALPESGYLELAVEPLRPFELVLSPITANGFAPELGQSELERLRARLLTLYPASDALITLGPGLVADYALDATGEGWETALDDLLDQRLAAQPSRQVFYYGALAPAPSYDDYCGEGCILGLSNVARLGSVYERGAIGIAVFQDGSGAEDAWDTLLHELGHALGRKHADCGEPDDLDSRYPYDKAGMGDIYGYDFEELKLIQPQRYHDVMSYCTPVWISDYTYSGIFERLALIDAEAFRALSAPPSETLRVARVDRFGRASWRGERRGALGEVDVSLELLDASGRRVGRAAGRVSRLDHLPSVTVWFSSSSLLVPRASAVDLTPVGGGVLPL